MKILIIDNYDSFTFNLFHLAAQVSGTEPVVIENDRAVEPGDFTHVILSPGPGRPESQRDFGICKRVIHDWNLPLLGVCLGHQGIAVEFGGKVIHAPEVFHGKASRIQHTGRDLFSGVPQNFSAVRYHSLCVPEPLPECLEKLAWTADGLVMALRHRKRPLWGVQFHPESILTECGAKLMANFLQAPR